jgi:hypothetical protein
LVVAALRSTFASSPLTLPVYEWKALYH